MALKALLLAVVYCGRDERLHSEGDFSIGAVWNERIAIRTRYSVLFGRFVVETETNHRIARNVNRNNDTVLCLVIYENKY